VWEVWGVWEPTPTAPRRRMWGKTTTRRVELTVWELEFPIPSTESHLPNAFY